MPPKLSYRYANIDHSFSSVSELRDALLASYPGAAYLGSPIVLVNRDDPAPAWGWLAQLLKARTDWWPAAGVALQHATQDGGDHARIALADFLDTYQESVVLLEWTTPIAGQWPDVRAGMSGSTFGDPDHRLATIVVGQRTLWDEQQHAKVAIAGLGAGGTWLTVDVSSEADLAALLVKSAAAGNPDGEGPWHWLISELRFHHQMQPWVPAAFAKLAAGSLAEVCAILDWFFEQHDLWRHVALLEAWSQTPPAWWSEPADKLPPKWKYPVRTNAADARTLGDVAVSALNRAQGQAQARPTVDLAPIFGGRPA